MLKTQNKFWLKSISVVTLALAYAMINTLTVFSAALTTASITLGDPRPSTTSTYTAQASSFSTGTSINCIQLDIGTSADGTGDAGLDLSSITLDSTTIPSSGSWTVGSVDGATDQMRATLVAGANPNASGNIVWGGVVNGATPNTAYFGVLSTYANTDCSTGGAIDSVTMTFIYKDGALVTLTIDPTLSFTVAGVASGQDLFPVGGASLLSTVTTTATAVNHASTVSSSTNGVSAHDLTTGTNATGGFNVYVRHTALLTSGGNTIATGGLSAGAFTAPGTEGWAWTSDDSDLGTPLNGSGSGLWNSFTTSNVNIATETAAASTTDRVGHQVGVSTTTPAGTYTTTIIYTAVATY